MTRSVAGTPPARVGPVLLRGFAAWVGLALLDTAAVALLVVSAGAGALPVAYLVGAGLTMVVGLAVARLGADPDRQLARLRLLFGAAAVATALLGVGLLMAPSGGLAFVAKVWYGVVKAIVPLALWAGARRRFDLDGGKRWFGVINAMQPVGGIAAYAAVPVLVVAVGTESLVLLGAAALGISALLFAVATAGVARTRPASAATVPAPRPAPPRPGPARVLRLPMVGPLVGFAALEAAVGTLLGYNYVAVAAGRYPDPDSVAAVVGLALAAGSVLAVLAGAVIAPPVLRRFGIPAALGAHGVLIATACAAAAAVDLGGAGVGGVLVAVVVVRVLDEAASGLSGPGARLLGRALPPDRREVANTLADGVTAPLAIAAAALVLLAARAFDARPATISVLAALGAVGIVAMARVVGRGYPALVREALAGRRLAVAEAVLDPAARDVVSRSLGTGTASAVRYALDLLGHGDPEELRRRLPDLLGHPDEQVRCDVLDRIERLALTDLGPAVAARLPYEGSARVRGASLRVLGALGGADAIDDVAPALTSPDPVERSGAMVGLLRSGDVEAVLVAGEPLLTLIRSGRPGDRLAAARVLHESGRTGLHRPVLALVADPDPVVAREALRAAAAVRHRRLWPAVVDAVARPEVRAAAQRALEAGGADALPAVAAALGAAPEPAVAGALLETCPRLGAGAPDVVLGALRSALQAADRRVADAAVHALLRLRVRCREPVAELLLARLDADLDVLAELLADQRTLTPPGSAGIAAALVAAENALVRRTALGLAAGWAVMQDPELAERAMAVLAGPAGPEERSYVREAIETGQGPRALSHEIAAVATAPDPDAMRAALAGRARAVTPSGGAAVADALRRVVATGLRGDALLAGLALHIAAERHPGLLAELMATLGQGAPRLVADTAALLSTPTEGRPMTPVERVLALLQCEVFTEADPDALALLAEQAADRPVEAGEVLFTEGDPPEALYVVVDGLVAVERDGRERMSGSGHHVPMSPRGGSSERCLRYSPGTGTRSRTSRRAPRYRARTCPTRRRRPACRGP